MRQNLGTMDRYCRLSAGVLLLTLGAARLERSAGLLTWLLLGCGATMTTQGLLGWDPLLSRLGISTLDADDIFERNQSNPPVEARK